MDGRYYYSFAPSLNQHIANNPLELLLPKTI